MSCNKNRVKLHDKTFEVMISAEEIDRAVEAVAAKINADYADRETPLFLGVLNGSFMFMSDLMTSYATNEKYIRLRVISNITLEHLYVY